MTVSQELRKWATESLGVWFSDLSDEALFALREVGRVNYFRMLRLEYLDRRTFALLVACALEDDDADQA